MIGINEKSDYSVPAEAAKIFRDEILRDPKMSRHLPLQLERHVSNIRITGKKEPTMPVNWRFAEAAGALHALEAILLCDLLEKKYQIKAPKITIDT